MSVVSMICIKKKKTPYGVKRCPTTDILILDKILRPLKGNRRQLWKKLNINLHPNGMLYYEKLHKHQTSTYSCYYLITKLFNYVYVYKRNYSFTVFIRYLYFCESNYRNNKPHLWKYRVQYFLRRAKYWNY